MSTPINSEDGRPKKEELPPNDNSKKDIAERFVKPHPYNINYTNNFHASVGNFSNEVSDDAAQKFDQYNQSNQPDPAKPIQPNSTLSDPTKPLPQKPKGLLEPQLDELPNYCEQLNENSLILVTCSDANTAFSVAYSLADKSPVSCKRLFTGEWGTLKNLTDEPNINIILNSKIGDGNPTLIIIDTRGMQTFLDSLVVELSTATLIEQELKDLQIFCICLADPKVLETTLERKRLKLSFPHWEIPFEQEAPREGAQQVRREQSLSYENGQVASSLCGTADTLKKTVLYVAAFFKNLNINDFGRVLTLLLADQTTPVPESEGRIVASVNSVESIVSVTLGDQVVTFSPSQKMQGDQGQATRLNQSQPQRGKLLWHLWEENTEQLLKDCCLTLAVNEYGSRVIEFSAPHLRSELNKYFEDEKFIEYTNKFRKLVELNLLFDKSSQVSKSLIDLSVSMMLFQPGTEFWVNWLEKSVMDALERGTNRKSTDYLYYCISDLLRETLDHSLLEDLTGIFLERMFSLKQHDAVLSISKRLRFSPQFNEYYWFKQSIDRGGEAVSVRAYQLLYNQMKQSKSRVYETLEKIHAWLPDLETDPEKYSPSNKYALQILLEYLVETLEEFEPKLCGEKALVYPLFGGLVSDESIDRKLKMIIEWILHPGMNSIIDDVDSLSIASILVIPGLCNILFGLKEDMSIKPEFSKIADSLFRSINDVMKSYEKKTSIRYRNNIIEYWRSLSVVLLEVSNNEIHRDWVQSDLLSCRRNIVEHLIEKLDV